MTDNDDLPATEKQTKKLKKKPDNPFEAAGYKLVQIRFQIEEMIKGFSDKDRKNPNYKQFLKDVMTEVSKAVDPKAREDHTPKNIWNKVLDFVLIVIRNPVLLAIICIILGVFLGNNDLLLSVIKIFKG
jgi:hypothetical protein